MITFSRLGKIGRLGNQMFQIASTIGIADRIKKEYGFPLWEYEKYFKNPLIHKQSDGITMSEPCFNVDYDFINSLNSPISRDLYGFFQSETYFINSREQIKSQFEFKEEFIQQVTNYYNENDVFSKPVVAISIRRGDYVNNPNYAQLPITYYFKSLLDNFDLLTVNIIMFSDDIPYCKAHFGCLENVYFSEGNSDIEDMCLMSQCNHFIISNSTFSWWGAWLGETASSIIVRPDCLFDNEFAKSNNSSDFYPERWKAYINTQSAHLDLTDVTFTIPVAYDHKDRLENLELCLIMLRKYFNCTIMICEQGSNIFEYLANKYNCEYSSVDYKEFHRTKMLNEMAKKSITPFIANWDADVYISPLSIFFATNSLRCGEDMVYPYSWAFARMPREIWYEKLRWALDIGIVGNTMFNGMYASDVESCGGAVLFNRKSFIEGGMENEYFISFGAEDSERKVRFEKLGYRVSRANGVLYHLNHFVGINSNTKNPFFLANREEFEKVRMMDKEELIKYIKTWSWIV